jgi:hypothetical protein
MAVQCYIPDTMLEFCCCVRYCIEYRDKIDNDGPNRSIS